MQGHNKSASGGLNSEVSKTLELRLTGKSGEVAVALDRLRRLFKTVTVRATTKARKVRNAVIVYVEVEL
jgi:hypothetical protein